MRRSIPLWSVALAAAPLAISHPDSSVTELRIAGGSGAYAHIVGGGCEFGTAFQERVEYDNVGGEVSHMFARPVRFGLRAGRVSYGPLDEGTTLRRSATYINPHISLDWPFFSIGGGLVSSDGHLPEEDSNLVPSAHIRLGKRFYLETSFYEAVPIATAGYAQIGLGARLRKTDLWLGLGTGPGDVAGFVARGEHRIGNRLGIGGTARLCNSEGIEQNAFAVALSYRWVHRAATEPPGATAPAASDSARSPRRGRSRAPRDRRSRRVPC
jgi:hypothetical protein